MTSFSVTAENSNILTIQHLRVLIVGCGNIAGGFDYGRFSSGLPCTHAGAYVRDGRFKITACVEPDDNRLTEFMEAWGVPVGFISIEEISDSNYQFDVISICSPTIFHAHHLEIALRLKPKLIFCEKPVTTTLAETEKLVNECRKNDILLAMRMNRESIPLSLHCSKYESRIYIQSK